MGRALAFGWKAIEIDGHNLEEIDEAYAVAINNLDCPTVIVARTKKGKGVANLEDISGWHGKALKPDDARAAIAQLGDVSVAPLKDARHTTIGVSKPNLQIQRSAIGQVQTLQLPIYQEGDSVATRKAYGDALKALGASRPDVVALDGEVSNSTYAEEFAKAYPDRYFEMYIAEQQMVAAAVGLQVRQYKPFASSFAAFLSRAYDFVRMAAISRANIKLVGSHAGVSIGQDDPSQMALEDLAALRAVWNSTVLYPCDANQTAKLVAYMVDRDGIVYLRTTRESTPVLYGSDEDFPVGGSKVIRSSSRDRAAVIAAGITVHEALKAYERLKQEGIEVRVIDAYSVKPIDTATLHRAARDTAGKLVIVEDHWSEGGLGAAVLDAFVGTGTAPAYGELALNLVKLAVQDMPGSGTPEELLHAAKIDANAIVEAVQSLV